MRAPLLTILALALIGPPAARAQSDTSPTAYALVVGANSGGAGQDPLQFAERDAASVARVLSSIGRFDRTNVVKLEQPTPAELRSALRSLSAKLSAHEARGDKTTLLFYYSGHSRSAALNLGESELPLRELRAELTRMPATLKIVILDACQSGTFSNVKGVAGAADFSVNSIKNLDASGMVVMASSSGSELSQESSRLGSSYFTHYLLVALRGAGDDNRDGRVTLSEAYRYAYNRTLAATAVTAVGRQHVTLETDLRGKGEIPLSFPTRSNSALVLRARDAGDYLIQTRATASVVAEVHKVAGQSLRIAIAPGAYRVVIRRGGNAQMCDASVAPGRADVFRPTGCESVDLESGVSKGLLQLQQPTWGLELAGGFGYGVEDAFTERLSDFGFDRDQPFIGNDIASGHVELSVTGYIGARVHLVGSYLTLAGDDFTRSTDTETETFKFGSRAFLGAARLTHPLTWQYPTGRWGGVIPFVDLGLGAARSTTALRIGEMDPVRETHWGPVISAAAGGQLMIVPAFGFYAKARYAVAPTIDNLIGDTHDVGGWFFSLGIRGAVQ